MKLATLKDGSRDGQLVVVSRDLAQAHFATGIATRLQQVLDDWNFLSPQLEDLSATLNGGKARHAFAFDTRQCMAPLPRACHYVEATAYHAQRTLLDTLGVATGLQRRASDHLHGPTDDVLFFDPDDDIDFEAGLVALTGDVPAAATPEQALDGVRLLLLASGWVLRRRQARSPLQALAATSFGPLAVTPDELGDAWAGGRVHLPLQSRCHGRKLGLPDAADGLSLPFGEVIAEAAQTRAVRAGSLFGSGAVANADPTRGFGCIAGKRAAEAADGGTPHTPWLRWGDTVQVDMKGRDGSSVFGAIAVQVVGPLGLEEGREQGRGMDEADTAPAEPGRTRPVDADPGETPAA
ncbi:fumarylacetoacetate hydrolase family protein [Pseudorhodoferax sp.]|uniref:fumarylacetoacetate hydrolase family protein n=1 Tax=Pseudorhodoferax sp. TaxID=1993553 RepID=UPI002DD6BA27|nr:fumarylacetoacetate hydrolase family protein [Pseudorhodoferax sp.]